MKLFLEATSGKNLNGKTSKLSIPPGRRSKEHFVPRILKLKPEHETELHL